LGVDNFKALSLDDPHANYKPNLKQYLKTKKLLAMDKYNLIEEHNFFEKL
jgi:hypothetical protein